MARAATQSFPVACRQWRQFRKLSQLDLAMAANVSQRHVSWLETGRSHPSREMVVRLCDALEVPLRERNVLFQAAGFAAAYEESQLDEPFMAPVLEALTRVLEHHAPLPAVVLDRHWNVKIKNRAVDLMLGLLGDPEHVLEVMGVDGQYNLALLTLHPQGLRQYISNWDQMGPEFVRRLQHDALATGDTALQARVAAWIRLAPLAETRQAPMGALLPVLPLMLNIEGLELSLFSVISTIGTPQDITTDELRIEAFYPTDTATAEFFHNAALAG